jgi:hypothetical protein
VLSFWWIRRNFFEIFYYSHHFYLVLLFATYFHANSFMFYVLPALILHLADRVIRTSQAYRFVRVCVRVANSPPGGEDRAPALICVCVCVCVL